MKKPPRSSLLLKLAGLVAALLTAGGAFCASSFYARAATEAAPSARWEAYRWYSIVFGAGFDLSIIVALGLLGLIVRQWLRRPRPLI